MARESPRGRALDDAARAVLAGCAVSGTQAVKLHATLWMALEAACKRAGKPPEEHAADVAERMLAAWKEHMELGRVLKFRWGLHRFFGEGHWLNTAGWVVDQEKLKQLRMQRNASVGSY